MLRQFPCAAGLLITLTLMITVSAQPPAKPGDVPREFPTLPPAPLISESDRPKEPAMPPIGDDANKTFELIPVAPSDRAAPAEGPVSIGFFNHSDREVVLEINGQTLKLPVRDRIQIRLPREFTWGREKDGAVQKTKVPENAEGVEIVFKR